MRGALAVWAVTLSKHSGQAEVVVGIPYANREHPATHSVVGYFVNTLAIRVRVDGSASFRESLMHVSSVMSGGVGGVQVGERGRQGQRPPRPPVLKSSMEVWPKPRRTKQT